MAEVKSISVYTKYDPVWKIALRHAMVWGYLIGAEALSHLWFGGSWVIDLLVIAIAMILIVERAGKAAGLSVAMTTGEIRLWVAAGMPLDVKVWREQCKLRDAAGGRA